MPPDLLLRIVEHARLVGISTLIAVAFGLPAGVLAVRSRALRGPVMALASILQTVPSLALFGLLIPLPVVGGIGARAAVIALVVYGVLPVVRNTVAGIEGVDPRVREAAVAMGMTPRQVLARVELPLAAKVILAGVRVAAVTGVGVATVAAAVGAGGLGIFIFRGLRMNDNALLLAGAIPAAALALAVDAALGALERLTERPNRSTGRVIASVAPLVAVALLALVGAYFVPAARAAGGGRPIVVGSKDFTEQVVLGELVAQLLEADGAPVVRQFELGGSLSHDALVAGRIDVYPEYTGTALMAILHHAPLADARAAYDAVHDAYKERFAACVSAPLGFGSDFAVLVRGSDVRRLGLRTISDAVPLSPRWRAGFGQDFASRPDGYAGFARTYNLHFAEPPREMDLSLTYRALAAHQVDMIVGNATDGMIAVLDLVQLDDDKHYFPPYEAVLIARQAVVDEQPALGRVLQKLAGAITTDDMRALNYAVDNAKITPASAVHAFRTKKGL